MTLSRILTALAVAAFGTACAKAATLDLVADAVAGKAGFANGAGGAISAANLGSVMQAAEDPVTGALWVADSGGNRVVRFSSAAAFSSGEAANLVLGQADFASSQCNRGLGAAAAETLCMPSGVAVDQAGRVHVADAGNNRILVYRPPLASGMAAADVIGQADFAGKSPNRGGAVGAGTLLGPRMLALDATGNLFVADYYNNRVLRYAAPVATGASANKVFGQAGFTTDTAATTATGLYGPSGLAIDRDDNLWVASEGSNRVLRYNGGAASGDTTADLVLCQASFTTSLNGTTASTCSAPGGVAVDCDGAVYVTDYFNHRVLRFTTLANGASATAVIGQANFTSGQCNRGLATPAADSLCYPMSALVDRLGNALVGEYGNHRLLRYDLPRARPVPALASLSPPAVPAGSGAFTLTVNGARFHGDSVVNWNGSPRPTAYLSDRRLVAQVAAADLAPGGPFAITVSTPSPGGGTSAFLNVTTYAPAPLDGAADRVLGQPGFDAEVSRNPAVGEEVLGFPGASTVGLASLLQLVVDPASGRLFAADFQAHRVMSWPSAQAFSNAQPADLILGQPDEFSTLCNRGLAAPSSASLCVPYGLAVDPAGALYVADKDNHRVLQFVPPFSTGMAATRVFGQGGSFDARLPNSGGVSANGLKDPIGVAVSGGVLFVLDAGNNRILGYRDPYGDFTADFAIGQPDLASDGAAPASATRFTTGEGGLAVDGEGRLHAALFGQHRVLRFSPPFATNMAADLVLGQAGFTTTTPGTSATTLENPVGVTVDASGGVLVADHGNNRVVRYAPPFSNGMAATGLVGQPGFVIATATTGASGLDRPVGVALDRAGRLYVNDFGNARILAYDRPFATRLAKSDTTGNGKSDLVWRASDGGFAVWDMNAGALTGFFYGIVDNAWQIVATGDFDGDGHADLFWRRTDGATYLWFMKGTYPVGFVNTGVVPLEYTPVAIADFDGNGKADVMFRRSNGQNYLWLMSDGLITSQGFFGGTLPLEWVVQGADDLDGDGRADIVWRNTNTGEVYVWTMNGLTVAGAAPVLPTLTLDWQIQGLADFDADGKADIQWRHTTGNNYLFTMNGATVKAYIEQADVGPEWVIQGFGDFNADGFADIVYRHATTGEVVVWLMQVNAPTAAPSLGNPGAIWTLSQP
jgi:sugar lactone lactonase YvrE